MVRYPIDRQALLDLIAAERPTWLGRAKARTDEYVRVRHYSGGSEFWGEIKNVYIRLQHEKCAYCETKLQGAQLASKVHEVEHFRPKQSVKGWPNPGLAYLADFVPPCAMGSASRVGYYKLAYHPFNYAIACTRCNSTLKSNYFPVRGKRRTAGADPSRMQAEGALLVYPISDIDDDPGELVTFDGVLAVAKHKTGPEHARAVTIIRFFQLNHEDLATRRAEMIGQLWLNLEFMATTSNTVLRERLRVLIDATCSARGQFSACMRAFRELYANDHDRARSYGEMALTNG